MNTFGKNLTLTTFGESHGPAIGGVIDGMPPRVKIDLNRIQSELNRRRPGQSAITTARREPDTVRILSGMMDNMTLGTPIGFVIENANQHSSDYDEMRHVFRPSHADFTYQAKYGIRDHRGGGRASARETAARVVGGAFARQWLEQQGIAIMAWTSQVGDIAMPEMENITLEMIESNAVRCPHTASAQAMEALIASIKAEGDTIGGIIECRVTGIPAGIGEPHFNRLNSRLGAAMLSIPACKAVEFGMGFDGCIHRGSEMLDEFTTDANGKVVTLTNNSGGIQGGISNGMPICFRVGFKPVATLLRPVHTISDSGAPAELKARGRHDPCVLPRAVPIVEAMAALTIADMMISSRN